MMPLIKPLVSLVFLLSLVTLGTLVIWILYPSAFERVDYKEASAPIPLSADVWSGGGYLGLTPDRVARISLKTFNETNLIYYARIRMDREAQAIFLNQLKPDLKSAIGHTALKHKPKWMPIKGDLNYLGFIREDNAWGFHIYSDQMDYIYLKSS